MHAVLNRNVKRCSKGQILTLPACAARSVAGAPPEGPAWGRAGASALSADMVFFTRV